jgi:hypothetical protein
VAALVIPQEKMEAISTSPSSIGGGGRSGEETPTQSPPSRRSRLSVSHANALANFDALQAHFSDRQVVVFLDYDGTLTPIVNDPALAKLSPAMRATLEKLREKFVTGVITGRSLHKIQSFVGIPQLFYAGSHGFDIKGPDGTAVKNQVAAQFLADLHEIRDVLTAKIADIPGASVEDNIFSISLHYRCVRAALLSMASRRPLATDACVVLAPGTLIRVNMTALVLSHSQLARSTPRSGASQ